MFELSILILYRLWHLVVFCGFSDKVNEMLAVMKSSILKCYALLGVVMVSQFSVSSGELIQFTTCGDTSSGTPGTCDVKNVEILPCPEAADKEPCSVYRGTNMTIKFDWYPPFSSENYTSAVYSSTLLVDIPDIDHSRPGCQYSKCPIVAGEKHSFAATRFVKPVYPPGPYLVKYKLWNDFSKGECCFLVNINVI